MNDGVVCFDLEGPLSPQDNALELFNIIPAGKDIFAVISRYNYLLAIGGRTGHEPGDTLALIHPFLFRYGIKPSAITKISRRSTLISGAKELVNHCLAAGWHVYVVSTAYEPHARTVSRRLNLSSRNVIATQVEKEYWNNGLSHDAKALIAEAESYIRQHFCGRPFDRDGFDEELKDYLDELYLNRLPSVGIDVQSKLTTVIGGRRKVKAIERIARRRKTYLQDLVFVGDSITDAAAMQVIDVAGGLAISFNGNKFAVPNATLAVASTSLLSLTPILDAWKEGGKTAVKTFVDFHSKESPWHSHDYLWNPKFNKDILQETIKRHNHFRRQVRQDAGPLG